MNDNGLQISFDYKYPDNAVLITYRAFGGIMFGDTARISVVKTYVGEEAIRLYSALTGKSIPSIHKEAGYKGDEDAK